MNKSIVIALGGTGTEVVELVRKRLTFYCGTESPDECRFIYVDTDEQNNPVRGTRPAEFCAMSLDRTTIGDCMNKNSALAQRLDLATWMDPFRLQQLTPLSSGADGVRAYGRLALLAGAGLPKLIGLLESSIAQLLAGSNTTDNDENGVPAIRVFVVASAGGGSGSGFFIDMGYLTRLLMPNSAKWEQTGIVTVAPETYLLNPAEAPGKRQNSAALLDELDHFSKATAVFTADYNNRELPEVVGRGRPYQYCYIVSPMAGTGALRNDANECVRLMWQRMADMVFMRLVGPGEIGSRQSDFNNNMTTRAEDKLGYPNAFCTFGVSVRQFPAIKYLPEAIGKAITRTANTWLKQSATDTELKVCYQKFYDDFASKLGLPPDNVRDNGYKRDNNQDRLYLNLITSDQTSPLELIRNPQDTAQLNFLFDYKPGDPVNISSPGYIAGVIQKNRNKSVAELTALVRQTVDTMAFDTNVGPKVALRFMAALAASLEKETQFMQECKEKLSGTQLATVAAPKRIRDPWLGPWQGTLNTSTAVTASPQLAEEKNRKMESALLDAKMEVYAQFIKEMDARRPFVTQLQHYIVLWRDSRGAATMKPWKNSLIPGVVLADDIVDAKIERFMVAPDAATIEDIQKEYVQARFATELPKQRDTGALELQPFATLEAAIDKALTAQYDAHGMRLPITDTIGGESVIRLMGEQNRDNWQNDVTNLVKDAWPLLILNVTDTHYAHLLPPNKDGFPKEVELYWFINNATAHPSSHTKVVEALQQQVVSINNNGCPTISAEIGLLSNIDPVTVGIVYLRGAFPSRIIDGLGPDARRRLLGEAASNYYSRADVLSPANPTEIEQAEARLILLEALRLGACLPDNLNTVVQDGRYRITYHDTQDAVDGFVNAARWNTAVHELAVKSVLSKKIDKVLENHFSTAFNRGEAVKALAELRATLKALSVGHNVAPPQLTWDLTPAVVEPILNRIDTQYQLALTDESVREARKLLLTILTLVHDEEIGAVISPKVPKDAVSSEYGKWPAGALLPHRLGKAGLMGGLTHEFDYHDSSTGIAYARTIKLDKMNANVAARTLAANTVARDEFDRVWSTLKNAAGGNADSASALAKMIGVIDIQSSSFYCPEMDMLLEAPADADLLCEVVQPILPDNRHPWAVKQGETWACGTCSMKLPEKPNLRGKCPNPSCPRHR